MLSLPPRNPYYRLTPRKLPPLLFPQNLRHGMKYRLRRPKMRLSQTRIPHFLRFRPLPHTSIVLGLLPTTFFRVRHPSLLHPYTNPDLLAHGARNLSSLLPHPLPLSPLLLHHSPTR